MLSKTPLSKFVLLLSLVLPLVAWSPEPQVKIFLIGDSTMADKPVIGNPERGWGQVLPALFTDDVLIENHARNGRSTKSFISEGRWKAVEERLRPGDYVFIQFGHNDEKKEDTSRYAEAHTDFRTNLARFVDETRSKGAQPVLLTPISRRRFDDRGMLVETHGDYPDVVRAVAAGMQVPLIDMNSKSMALLGKLGPEESKKMYLWARSGLFSARPEGRKDDTHFNERGALTMARFVADGIRALNLPLGKMLKADEDVALPGVDRIVLLDEFYNNEWRKDAKGKPTRYHYVWEDTTNSGFSILGRIITGLGASIDSLCEAPTPARLKNASVYVIVDPDTPLETEHPNFIGPEAIGTIVDWVKGGGVLVLMENDKGNSEFEHFNQLAEKFGIHFNEDSRNRVTGNAYDMGKFDSLPEHALFNGVKQIYMKEISTLRLREPASPLFVDHGDVIIATASVGHGFVFAVGDPWFYNEYTDHRKLPAAYDNDKAARNLFDWLLKKSLPVQDY